MGAVAHRPLGLGRVGQLCAAGRVRQPLAADEDQEPGPADRWTLPLGSHTLTLGGSYLNQRLKDQTGNQLANGPNKVERYQWALFAETEWLTERASPSPAGYAWTRTRTSAPTSAPAVRRNGERWTLKGGVSTGFRSPDLRQTVAGGAEVSRGGTAAQAPVHHDRELAGVGRAAGLDPHQLPRQGKPAHHRPVRVVGGGAVLHLRGPGGSYAVNKRVSVYAGIYNLFDKQVGYDDYGYVEDGRRYWLGVGVKF